MSFAVRLPLALAVIVTVNVPTGRFLILMARPTWVRLIVATCLPLTLTIACCHFTRLTLRSSMVSSRRLMQVLLEGSEKADVAGMTRELATWPLGEAGRLAIVALDANAEVAPSAISATTARREPTIAGTRMRAVPRRWS